MNYKKEQEKKWYGKLNYQLLNFLFTVMMSVVVYFEASARSSHDTKKDIAVLQTQFAYIKEYLIEIREIQIENMRRQ